MIALDQLCVNYGPRRVLDGVSMFLDDKPVILMGPSGSGTSTLLRVIAGLQEPTSGRVLIGGKPVGRQTWRAAADSRVALIHQDYRLVGFLSAGENLLLAAEVRGMRLPGHAVLEALERVGLDAEVLGRSPATLSGGEQQRIAIARALLCDVKVLLADEPTGALDAAATALVADTLFAVADSCSVAVIIATHDSAIAERAGRTITLRDGGLWPS